ncbi:MAG TPA: Gfo/Idh/MocA family oxidoreductase [Dehalococcoidia bacterium]|nr:Gfo/Idh/MocA family oxidoreductase [Dehalococcoidia bacterium]
MATELIGASASRAGVFGARPLRVAVIGCGYWGPNLVRNFFDAPGSTVTRVCDLEPERLDAIGKRYPTIGLGSDWRDVVHDPDVDAVCIATPAATHYAIAREALNAGKHVWVEKPLSMSFAEARELTELATKLGRVLLVDHTFVYTPAVQRMRQSIVSGELGDLLYYDSIRVNLGMYQHDVNVIWDLGVHDFSIIDYLLPYRPSGVSAVAASQIADSGREGLAYVTLHFEGDFIAHFHVSWLAPVKIRLATVCGTKRMIVFDDTAPSEKLKIYDRGIEVSGSSKDRERLQVEYRTGDMSAPKLDQVEALQIAAQHFAECVATGATPITDGAAGARVVAMLEATQRSLAAGGRVEKLDF